MWWLAVRPFGAVTRAAASVLPPPFCFLHFCSPLSLDCFFGPFGLGAFIRSSLLGPGDLHRFVFDGLGVEGERAAIFAFGLAPS